MVMALIISSVEADNLALPVEAVGAKGVATAFVLRIKQVLIYSFSLFQVLFIPSIL